MIKQTSHTSASPGQLFFNQQYNIVDLLVTRPTTSTFAERVEKIGLSRKLLEKVHCVANLDGTKTNTATSHYLSEEDEKELASEVLLARHKFTTLTFENRQFRQAALTIIQNIYLFKQRKIFFGTSDLPVETERQQALYLFSQTPDATTSIPLTKTFQHLILSRVWQRITTQADDALLKSDDFHALHEVVEQLNTLRNIYMLLSIGLAGKLTRNISSVYRQSITSEDAQQIGSFGIARAAYRYHPSCGLRFSTYASRWVLKEIQRQSLEGRLIRISTNLVEKISQQAQKKSPNKDGDSAYEHLCRATAQLNPASDLLQFNSLQACHQSPQQSVEIKELQEKILHLINEQLSPKSGDVILRRYGLGPYKGQQQSVIEIAKQYGVTRGSIYQLEQTALKKLKLYCESTFEFS